jgi:site-specific DNA recombinase
MNDGGQSHCGVFLSGNLPLGYEMKDGKIAVVEEEAELVRSIFRRYLELGGVNELLRDLRDRNIRTKTRLLSTGATRGGIPFGRGALYYLMSNHFYIGEVKYKNEILPGEQPPIMDRALFEAVRQKSLAQWSHRTLLRSKSDHLLTGLLFDDAGSNPRHQSRRPLSLLRVDVCSPWRGQDSVGRLSHPRSSF